MKKLARIFPYLVSTFAIAVVIFALPGCDAPAQQITSKPGDALNPALKPEQKAILTERKARQEKLMDGGN